MPESVPCPRCGRDARELPHHAGHCPHCFHSFRTDRLLTAARREQGFKSQQHLDAFYRYRDHVKDCAECGQPGAPMVLADNSLQPTARECPTGRELFAASLADARDLPEAPAPFRECPCGQLLIGHHDRCDSCRAAERQPQGQQDRLFTPTAAPIPGQQTL